MKTVSLYTFTKDSQFDLKSITEETLSSFKFTPCGELDLRKTGFAPNSISGMFVDEIKIDNETFTMMTIREQVKSPEKYLVENYVEAKKLQYITDTDGNLPEKSVVKEWKEEGTNIVLATTHPKKPKDYVILIRSDGVLFVEAKGNKAESLLSLLRKAVGSLPVIPMETDKPVTDFLDDFVVNSGKDIFTLGNKAVLIDGDELVHTLSKGSVYDSDAADYVKNGMMTMELALNYDGVVDLILKDGLIFDSIKFDKEFNEEGKDDEAGNFFLQMVEINKFVNDILSRLK